MECYLTQETHRFANLYISIKASSSSELYITETLNFLIFNPSNYAIGIRRDLLISAEPTRTNFLLPKAFVTVVYHNCECDLSEARGIDQWPQRLAGNLSSRIKRVQGRAENLRLSREESF